MEISFHSHLDSNTVIATKYCTWHDSCAVVACAKLCCDLIASNGIPARWSFHRIWIAGKKPLVKRAPDVHKAGCLAGIQASNRGKTEIPSTRLFFSLNQCNITVQFWTSMYCRPDAPTTNRMSMQGTVLVRNVKQKSHQPDCFIDTVCDFVFMTFNAWRYNHIWSCGMEVLSIHKVYDCEFLVLGHKPYNHMTHKHLYFRPSCPLIDLSQYKISTRLDVYSGNRTIDENEMKGRQCDCFMDTGSPFGLMTKPVLKIKPPGWWLLCVSACRSIHSQIWCRPWLQIFKLIIKNGLFSWYGTCMIHAWYIASLIFRSMIWPCFYLPYFHVSNGALFLQVLLYVILMLSIFVYVWRYHVFDMSCIRPTNRLSCC